MQCSMATLGMLKTIIVAGALAIASTACSATQDRAASAVAPTAAPTVAPQPGQQQVEVTEQTLTDELNASMAGRPFGSTPLGPATLTHLTAKLQSGQMVTDGDAQVGSTSVPVSVTGRVDVQDAKPVVVVTDARAAGVPLPDASRQGIRQAIQNEVDQQVQRMQLQLTSVTIGDGKMVLQGTPKR
jgi:hypothetical protein